MIHPPFSKGHLFEVSLYNKEVRALVKNNKSHNLFDDYWADLQVHGIVARDAEEARLLAKQRYPKKEGFVIESVTSFAA
ncbi:MAG: hypothetical protein ACO3MW_04020 [Rhodospirillales bacterium]|jgi:hypothetical protein